MSNEDLEFHGDTMSEDGIFEEGEAFWGVIPAQNYQFGEVSISNSNLVQFGDRYVSNGLMVVKQIVTPSQEKSPANHPEESLTEQNKGGSGFCPRYKMWFAIIAGIIAVGLLLATGYILTVLVQRNVNQGSSDNKTDSTNPVQIYDRSSWMAREPAITIKNLNTPVPIVMISNSATLPCDTFDQCTEMIRGFQDYHMDILKYEDISFNFLVGGDGRIYKGRGWDKVGQHTLGYNKISVGVCLIGNFMTDEPAAQQIDATHKLMQLGVDTGNLAHNYQLLGQRQVKNSTSPGERLFQLMKSWPHFNSSVSFS